MKGIRNQPTKVTITSHRVPQRIVPRRSPTRSADEALLNFVLGRTSESSGSSESTAPDPDPAPDAG